MADQIPSIIILKSGGSAAAELEEKVCRGIEEEGIPFEIKADPERSAAKLAHKAALASRLNVGVGIGADHTVAVHYSQLDEETPVFTESGDSAGFDFTALGVNAARLVKGLPFKDIT
ncbi:MAG TPA: glycerol dehydratase reactivase beta/small subunit family protein [Anaerovoracaceae bacterium]|nr:glycerol dehydratase reactivase beta/small subunit family protein [Anaerovoracaceae bacterium]